MLCNFVQVDGLIVSLTCRLYGQHVEDCLAPFRALNLVRPSYHWSTYLSISSWLVLLKLLRFYNLPSFVKVEVFDIEHDDIYPWLVWLSHRIKSVCIVSSVTACNYANGLGASGHTVRLRARPVNVYTLLFALKTIKYVTG